jgi:hypothetical protein
MAFDYKKEYKEFYMPKGTPSFVTVPKMNQSVHLTAIFWLERYQQADLRDICQYHFLRRWQDRGICIN